METLIKSPLVVGYRGEIGSFILQGILRVMSKACDIWCFDINETETEKIDRIRMSDVIFLCVPMQDTTKWLFKYKRYLRHKIIIEQTSLKSWLCDRNNFSIVHASGAPRILSMHLLFRPSATPNKEDRKVILINHDDWQFGFSGFYRPIKEITEADIVWVSNCQIHDQLMARQQALVHKILLTLDKTLLGIGGQTYIGKKLKELTTRIRGGDPKLYSLIQKNKYLSLSMKEFNKNLRNFNIEKEIC